MKTDGAKRTLNPYVDIILLLGLAGSLVFVFGEGICQGFGQPESGDISQPHHDGGLCGWKNVAC